MGMEAAVAGAGTGSASRIGLSAAMKKFCISCRVARLVVIIGGVGGGLVAGDRGVDVP